MKKLVILCSAFLLTIGFSASAMATSFSIGDAGTVVFGGLGTGDYNVTALTSSFELDEGEPSSTLDFFSVDFTSFSVGVGLANASIELTSPSTAFLDDEGGFIGFAVPPITMTLPFFGEITLENGFNAGAILWGAPVQIAYGNGGLLALDLHNLVGFDFTDQITISGTITNLADATATATTTAPVPEPATMLLLGVGLVGLAGIGRKTFFK